MSYEKKANKRFKFVPRTDGVSARREQRIVHYIKPETATPMNEHASVDDATWDKIVMDLMEEYDDAWTQLADR